MVAQVGFLVVAGNSFRCYFLTYHTSCAVVSVFWLRQEIVFGYSVSKKDSYSVSNRETNRLQMCLFCKIEHSFTLCLSTLYLSLVPERSVIFLSAFCEGIYLIPMLYSRKLCKF